MATIRGFVHKIEVGREGLVTVALIETDGTISNYVIRDLDADPERFNERLSKLAILRDAMDLAEPVEIEQTETKQGNEIQRAARITRDQLSSAHGSILSFAGLVLEISVHTENRVISAGELSDTVLISILTTDLTTAQLALDMQIPERDVAIQHLEMIRDAQTHGRLIRFNAIDSTNKRIISVAVDNNPNPFGTKNTRELDGFVESLSLIPLSSSGGNANSLAHVRFTTAPAFTGTGNTIDLVPFTPVTVDLLTPKGSITYDLFEAGLRDNNRMRVSVAFKDIVDTPLDSEINDERLKDEKLKDASLLMMLSTEKIHETKQLSAHKFNNQRLGIAFSAELLAPLASASHPVWVSISRKSLDHGIEGFECTEGLPSSDLTPQTLRDLRIPYPAVWSGIGCFNSGVYRFQFCLPVPFKLFVDDKELCLHKAEKQTLREEIPAKDAISLAETNVADLTIDSNIGMIVRRKQNCSVMFAHACLCGDHNVRVEIENWICEYRFVMDVYRIR